MINGCDGCLNPSQFQLEIPHNNTKGTHNGLAPIVKHLEKIFTNPEYPNGSPVLSQSMKESGKSRADLWAFGALLGALGAMRNNNEACDNEDGCVLAKGQDGCKIQWPSLPKFQTGRVDCDPGENADEAWHSQFKENHPNPHGNGIETVDFYKTHFNLNAREAIALTEGAHSLGNFRVKISGFAYQWTKHQTRLFNNQMLQHISNKPKYHIECKSMKTGPKGTYLIGDEHGNPSETRWGVMKNPGAASQIYQWMLEEKRCPGGVNSFNNAGNNDCSVINDNSSPNPNLAEKYAKANAKCCTGRVSTEFCQPSCVKQHFSDQTALSSDVGFYYHFETASDGKPYGCQGIMNKDWSAKWAKGIRCEKEEYAPDGEPLYQIVEEQAESNAAMMKNFAPALEKMVENGYQNRQESLTQVPAEWYMHVAGF